MTKWHNVGEESKSICAVTVGISENGVVFPIRCKQWGCKVCAPINALHWAIEVANGVQALFSAGVRPKFLTITQGSKVQTVEYAYSILHTQWDKFRRKWQAWSDQQGTPTFYAAFVEGQERRKGMPHFHIIGSYLPDKETVRDWVVSSGFGFQVALMDVKPNSGAAWYVSKYSTKSTDAGYMPKGFRRCRLSQNWPRLRWKSDLRESAAIVKKPGESYRQWAFRASITLDLDPDLILQSALAVLEQTSDEPTLELITQDILS